MNPKMMLPGLALFTASIGGATGCDPLTDDDYRGEAVLTIRGKIENRRAVVPTDVNLYLLWRSPNGSPNVAEQLEIQPTFPATFQLDIFESPIDLTATSPLVVRATWAHVVAAAPDTNFQEFATFPLDHRDAGVLGVDPRHMIYYVPDGVPAEALSSGILHGAQSPGYHIFDVKCISPARKAQIADCLAQFTVANPGASINATVDACGMVNPEFPWLERAPSDLNTQLTVELIDDLSTYTPDPSECVQ